VCDGLSEPNYKWQVQYGKLGMRMPRKLPRFIPWAWANQIRYPVASCHLPLI